MPPKPARRGATAKTKVAVAPRVAVGRTAAAAPAVPERVLALDVSSVCTGWALFDDGALTGYGKYHAAGVDHGERQAAFADWLLGMLRDATPDQLVIEKPYPGKSRSAYRVLTMYIGQAVEAHWLHFGAELPDENQVAPQTVKAAMRFPGGDGHADNKRIAVETINARYGLSLAYHRTDRTKAVSDDDVADAIALGAAWHLTRRAAA